jgi:hypothetical protein
VVIAQITATGAGLSQARWRNVRSLFNAALASAGASTIGRRSNAALLPAWRDLMARMPDRYDRAKLSKLARFCSLRGLTPEQVNDAVLTAFGEMLVHSAVERPKQVHRDACLTWNGMVDRIYGWPALQLTVPNHARTYAMPLEAFPPSFATDLQAYLDRQAGKDLFGNIPAPASGVTLRCHRTWLLELASALVLSGRDIASIRSLADLVAVDAAKRARRFFWQRNGQRKSGQLHNFARLILTIAKHWAKVPADQLEALREVRREVDPGKGDMTERNRLRLRAFDDSVNVRRLVNLPDTIMRSVAGLPKPGYNDAIRGDRHHAGKRCIGEPYPQTHQSGIRRVSPAALVPRRCATTIAVEDPRHVRDAHHVLGNTLATTEKYYNQARSLEASRRYHATLAALRSSLNGRDQETQ